MAEAVFAHMVNQKKLSERFGVIDSAGTAGYHVSLIFLLYIFSSQWHHPYTFCFQGGRDTRSSKRTDMSQTRCTCESQCTQGDQG